MNEERWRSLERRDWKRKEREERWGKIKKNVGKNVYEREEINLNLSEKEWRSRER